MWSLCECSPYALVSFLWVVWFPPASQKHVSRCISCSKLSLGMSDSVNVCAWCFVMACHLIQGEFLTPTQCSEDRLRIPLNPDQKCADE